jgi:hypothetical protein
MGDWMQIAFPWVAPALLLAIGLLLRFQGAQIAAQVVMATTRHLETIEGDVRVAKMRTRLLPNESQPNKNSIQETT